MHSHPSSTPATAMELRQATNFSTAAVEQVYSGPEGRLWSLLMGEQVHIGGFGSSVELADFAGVGPGDQGIDLCCYLGAGMRFLIRYRGVSQMTGVDMTPAAVDEGARISPLEGLSDCVSFKLADVCSTGISDAAADFVWGEDAWCYVQDKQALICEAVRIVRPGGTIAFTDWVATSKVMSDDEYQRFCAFMKFPNLATAAQYGDYLKNAGCAVLVTHDTGRFAPYVQLYIEMLGQLKYDALKILGYDLQLFSAVRDEMEFALALAREGKLAQAMIVARRAG
jgi:SAM-dependent methyltransferase